MARKTERGEQQVTARAAAAAALDLPYLPYLIQPQVDPCCQRAGNPVAQTSFTKPLAMLRRHGIRSRTTRHSTTRARAPSSTSPLGCSWPLPPASLMTANAHASTGLTCRYQDSKNMCVMKVGERWRVAGIFGVVADGILRHFRLVSSSSSSSLQHQRLVISASHYHYIAGFSVRGTMDICGDCQGRKEDDVIHNQFNSRCIHLI